MVTTTRSKCVSLDGSMQSLSDLSTLQAKVDEFRLTSDGTWLYLLQVSCGRGCWQVAKRYSEIRELWLELSKTLSDTNAQNSCTEHSHFLAGLEQDKFPRKHLLLTQHKLEARANKLDQFFLKLALRLNLCKPHELSKCRVRGCFLLELVASFFEVNADQAKKCASTGFLRSISMEREVQRYNEHFTTKRRRSVGACLNRCFSLGLQDQYNAVIAFAQRDLRT